MTSLPYPNLSAHPSINGRIEKLNALAGAPPPHSVKLLSRDEWRDLRSSCRQPEAVSPQIPADTTQ